MAKAVIIAHDKRDLQIITEAQFHSSLEIARKVETNLRIEQRLLSLKRGY